MFLKINKINILLQFIFISVIVMLFIFGKFDLSKINNIFVIKNFYFIFLIFLNTFITSLLFFIILSIVIKKKTNSFLICSSFLQGGLVNMFWPGSGLIYKFYKLKDELNINLAQYSVSQAVLSIFSLISFFLIAIFFSFIKITNIHFGISFAIFLSILIILFLLFHYKNKIYNFIKNYLIKIKKIKKFITDLKSVKNIIISKKNYFIIIFILFFFLSLMQCYIFYLATQEFGMIEVGLLDAFFIYLSSIILSTLLLINFFGLFEITLTLSAAFITKDYFDVIYVGFGLRTLSIISILFWIFLFSSINFIKKKYFKR